MYIVAALWAIVGIAFLLAGNTKTGIVLIIIALICCVVGYGLYRNKE